MEAMQRRTETTKWLDPWFFTLKPEFKLAFLYVVDACDWAGVLELSRPIAESMMGVPVDWNQFVEASDGKLMWLDKAKSKLWVRNFILYQQGGDGVVPVLYPSNNAHESILKLIDKHRLREFGLEVQLGAPKGQGRGTSNSNSKSRTCSQGTRNGPGYTDSFLSFWAVYPRKDAKGKAFEAWQKVVADDIDAETLTSAAKVYAESDTGQGDKQFIKLPATWINQRCWESDPESWKRGGAPKQETKSDLPF